MSMLNSTNPSTEVSGILQQKAFIPYSIFNKDFPQSSMATKYLQEPLVKETAKGFPEIQVHSRALINSGQCYEGK